MVQINFSGKPMNVTYIVLYTLASIIILTTIYIITTKNNKSLIDKTIKNNSFYI